MTTPSLEDLAARLGALEEQVQELQQEARVKAVAWQLNELHETTVRRFDRVDERLAGLERTEAAHSAKLQQIDDRMETGFTGVQNALDEILRELRGR